MCVQKKIYLDKSEFCDESTTFPLLLWCNFWWLEEVLWLLLLLLLMLSATTPESGVVSFKWILWAAMTLAAVDGVCLKFQGKFLSCIFFSFHSPCGILISYLGPGMAPVVRYNFNMAEYSSGEMWGSFLGKSGMPGSTPKMLETSDSNSLSAKPSE